MEGIGPHRFWGASMALDLVSELDLRRNSAGEGKKTVSSSFSSKLSSSAAAAATTTTIPEEEEVDDENVHENLTTKNVAEKEKEQEKEEQKVKEKEKEEEEEEEVHVLVMGAGDVRHVMRTMATLKRNDEKRRRKTKIVIYLYDTPIECLARHLLLLSIMTDWKIPIRARANRFLEIYGNCLVQERTNKYIAEKAQELIKFVCDNKGSIKGMVNLSHLKFKDTDKLESVFKSWQENVSFNMKELRDRRMRVLYGQRYDSRAGLVDWDYQNGVKLHAGIIHPKLFRDWRESGIAFEFGDETYTMPNKSLSSYAQGKERGQTRLRRGFWSDIVVSPYFTFGVHSDDNGNQHAKDLYHIQNKGTPTEQYRNHTVHISVYNMLSYFYEIETSRTYQMEKANDIYSGLDQRSAKAIEKNDQGEDFSSRKAYAMECAQNIMQLKDQIEIVLLTGEENADLKDGILGKNRYKHKFDMVWLSNHNGHLLKDATLKSTLKTDALALVETARNMVMLEKDKKTEYIDKIRLLAKQQKFNAPPLDKTNQGYGHDNLAFIYTE